MVGWRDACLSVRVSYAACLSMLLLPLLIAADGGDGHRRHPSAPSPAAIDDDAESAGAPGASGSEEPEQRQLGDAGMVLRDPPTFHLLVHHVSPGGVGV